MTTTELKLVKKIGASAFCVYEYIKQFPTAKTVEMEDKLGISSKTIVSVLKKLQDNKIIARRRKDFLTREIEVLPQESWGV